MYLVRRATAALNSPEKFYKPNGPVLITGRSSSASLNFSGGGTWAKTPITSRLPFCKRIVCLRERLRRLFVEQFASGGFVRYYSGRMPNAG